MWIRNPGDIASAPDEKFFHGDGAVLIQMQRARVEAALQQVNDIPSMEVFAEASQFIEEAAGLSLSPGQLLAIYSLYPYQRGRLADYGWGDTEIRDDALDVVANFFLHSRWPLGKDQVDIDAFTAKLRRVVQLLGY